MKYICASIGEKKIIDMQLEYNSIVSFIYTCTCFSFIFQLSGTVMPGCQKIFPKTHNVILVIIRRICKDLYYNIFQ